MAGSTIFADHYEYVVRIAQDAAVHSQSATGWSHNFEQVSPRRFSSVYTELCLGPVQIFYEYIDGAYRYSGRPWVGARVFLVLLPGPGQILCDGRPVPTGALLTYRWDATQRFTCSRLTRVLGVAVDESFLKHHTERRGKCWVLNQQQKVPLICTDEPAAVRVFERSVLNSLSTLGESKGLLNNWRARDVAQQSVVAALADALRADPLDERYLPPPSTRAFVVDKAVRYIETRLADQLSVGEMAAAVRVCPRTLRYSFEAVLGVTPTQYVRARRLSRVRRDLLAGGSDSIQGAANRWGFWHMGRFARYYRETFGEPPSRTFHVSTKGAPVSHRAAPLRGGPDCPPARIASRLIGSTLIEACAL